MSNNRLKPRTLTKPPIPLALLDDHSALLGWLLLTSMYDFASVDPLRRPDSWFAMDKSGLWCVHPAEPHVCAQGWASKGWQGLGVTSTTGINWKDACYRVPPNWQTNRNSSGELS